MRRRELFDPLRPDHALRSILNVSRFGPFAGVVASVAQRNPDAPAIEDERGTLSYGEVDGQANALARGLAARGTTPGSVVALLARDHRGLVLPLLACGKLGVRVVLMNTGFAKPQFADVTKREKVGAVLHDSEFVDLLNAIPHEVPRILTWVDERDGVDPTTLTLDGLIAGRSVDKIDPPKRPGGMVVLTSGTTGTPKGAPRDKVSVLSSAQFVDRVPIPHGGTVVMAAPIFHSTGLSQFTIALALECKVVFQQRRFDPEATLRNIADHRADVLVVVPTMLQRIVDVGADVLDRYDTSSLRVVFAAGSSISPDLSRRTEETFGEVLYNLYGSTECAVATVATPEDMRLAPGTVGRPPVGCRVAIYDENRRPITEPDVTGTIFVSSGLSFAGYTDGRHKEIVDGLLSSGDVGHFDRNGLLFVDGRDDDMIVSGGENVFPQEVEHLLSERPDVRDVAVIGVDDPAFGKRLRAFVVPAPDAARDEREIKDYVKANLARYKVPRDVVFIDELPRNATGKVLRNKLAEIDAGTG
ncbi:MAG TPA: acyl-CoA synthetase [Aldersonia sp.]